MPTKVCQNIGSELHRLFSLMRRSQLCFGNCPYPQMELTEMQARVIGFLFLNADREIFQKDIEKEFSIRRATVSTLLQTMEMKNLICRKSVPQDARLKKVALTPKAEEIAERTGKELSRLEEILKTGIAPQDLEAFFRVTQTICSNIEQKLKIKPKEGVNHHA